MLQLDSADEQAAAIRRELDGRMQRVAEMEKVFGQRECRDGVVALVVSNCYRNNSQGLKIGEKPNRFLACFLK